MLEVARAANVPRTTVRFYERAGLLPAAKRSASNYRLFDAETVVIVRFVKRAQELGFSLDELSAFLAASRARVPSTEAVAAFASQKLDDIDRKVSDLRRMRRAIETRLRQGPPTGPCPILASLGGVAPDPCVLASNGETRPSSRRRRS
jgi:DNA-binding transcriptional MerR regulator